jgi:hypothetical protein
MVVFSIEERLGQRTTGGPKEAIILQRGEILLHRYQKPNMVDSSAD